MVLVNQPHQLFKAMLSLETFLLSLSVSFSLLLVDLVFILEAILRLIESDLNGDEIRLHAMDHVLVLPLHHHFVVVGLFDLVQLILRRRQPSRLLHHCLLDRVLLSLRLLQFSFLGFEFLFLGEDGHVDVVILHANASQSCTHFLVLFVAEFPRWNHIVGL